MAKTSSRILITGASSGIGAEVAKQLSSRGVNLALVARRRANLDTVAKACTCAGANSVTIIEADVGIATECERLINEALSALGGLDTLFLNAGIDKRGPASEWESPDFAEQIMQVNYHGAVRCAWHALPHLKESRGLITVTSSLQGKAGFPGFTAYSGSKHALHGFFDALRSELIDDGVDITLICPGPVETEIGVRPDNPPGVMPVAECARLIIQGMDNRKREVVMTTGGKVALLLRPLFPSLIDGYIRKRLKAFYKE